MERDFEMVRTALATAKVAAPSLPMANRDVFLGIVNAISIDDFESLPELIAEDAELRIHGFPEFDGHWRGRADVIDAMARNFRKVTEQKTAIESMVEDDNSLVILIDESGRMKTSGEAYKVRAVIWCIFESGRLRRVEEFSRILA